MNIKLAEEAAGNRESAQAAIIIRLHISPKHTIKPDCQTRLPQEAEQK